MNWLDIVVLSVVGLRTWSGYRRGLLRQVFDLAGLIAGLMAAVHFYYPLQLVLARYMPLPPPILALISFCLILFGIMLAARVLGNIGTQFLKLPGLGAVNAWTGALIGVLVAIVMVSFLLSIMHIFAFPPVEAALTASVFAPYLARVPAFILAEIGEYIPWGEYPVGPPGEPLPPVEGSQL